MGTIHDLTLDPENARKRGERAEKALAGSLSEFGAARSIVVDADGVVRAGNGTVEAAIKAGITKTNVIDAKPDELVVVRRGDLKGDAAKAYAIADNRLAELAEWDLDRLEDQLDEIEYDPEELGFSSGDLADMFGVETNDVEEVEAKVEIADELQEKWGTDTGQVWSIVGHQQHRLMCGDSTDEAAVAILMNGEKAQCVFTDPPYGVSIAKKNKLLNEKVNKTRNFREIEDDDLSAGQLKDKLLPAFKSLKANIMADDCTLFVTAPQGGGDLGLMMLVMMKEAGLQARHILIWKKNRPTFSMGRLDYDYQHEPILLTWGKKHKRPMHGMHKSSVWEIDMTRSCKEHPTMKPVELYVNAYLNNSEDGDNVADIYAGSGTAFLAAEQVGRNAFGMEITPQYTAVILERMTDAGCKCERV